MSEQTVEFESERSFHKLYCENPENLKLVEESFGMSVIARGNVLKMMGSETSIRQCKKLFAMLQLGRDQGMVIKKSDFIRFLDKTSNGKTDDLESLLNNPLILKIRKNWFII